MRTKRILLIGLLLIPIVVLASGGDPTEPTRYFKLTGRMDDFWQRVFNFVIFSGIAYYYVATPIKNFFKERRVKIARQLKEIQDMLQASKDEVKMAEARLVSSKVKAKEIIADSQKEAQILADHIAQKNQDALVALDKNFEDKIEFESRKMRKDVIKKLLQERISKEDIAIDESKVVSLISKKVA